MKVAPARPNKFKKKPEKVSRRRKRKLVGQQEGIEERRISNRGDRGNLFLLKRKRNNKRSIYKELQTLIGKQRI